MRTFEFRFPVARCRPSRLNAAVLVETDSGNDSSRDIVRRFQNVTAESSDAVIRYLPSGDMEADQMFPPLLSFCSSEFRGVAFCQSQILTTPDSRPIARRSLSRNVSAHTGPPSPL